MKKKLFLILWCPDTATVPNKMLYASSYEALKQSLIGIQKYIQVRSFYNLSISIFFYLVYLHRPMTMTKHHKKLSKRFCGQQIVIDCESKDVQMKLTLLLRVVWCVNINILIMGKKCKMLL